MSARLPRFAAGGRPTLRRSSNFYGAAFRAHRDCNVRSVTYDGDNVECTGCGNKWLMRRDSRGEPIGYTIVPRINVAAFVE
jgi:hypothetical protein